MGDQIHEHCFMESPRCLGKRENPYSGYYKSNKSLKKARPFPSLVSLMRVNRLLSARDMSFQHTYNHIENFYAFHWPNSIATVYIDDAEIDLYHLYIGSYKLVEQSDHLFSSSHFQFLHVFLIFGSLCLCGQVICPFPCSL